MLSLIPHKGNIKVTLPLLLSSWLPPFPLPPPREKKRAKKPVGSSATATVQVQ
jgi:hypothetical protein